MAKKKPKKEAETRDEKRLHVELITQMLNLSTAGFGLVAALAWNETIQTLVKEFIAPHIPGSGFLSKLIYAIIVTVLAVFIVYQLSRLQARFPQDKK